LLTKVTGVYKNHLEKDAGKDAKRLGRSIWAYLVLIDISQEYENYSSARCDYYEPTTTFEEAVRMINSHMMLLFGSL